LARKIAVGAAGERLESGVVKLLEGAGGMVTYGPNAVMGSGNYQVTVEANLGTRPDRARDGAALLVEVLLDGYPLAARSVGHTGVVSESLEFSISPQLEAVSLSAGVQVRITSRDQVSGSIVGVLVEKLGSPLREPEPLDENWGAAMSVGNVGTRTPPRRAIQGSDRMGIVADGPHWRLDGGTYHVTIELDGGDGSPDATDAVVGLAEAIIHGYVISFVPITRHSVATGVVHFAFVVDGRWLKDRFTRVEIKVRQQRGVALRTERVIVQRDADVTEHSDPAGGEWLDALWVGDAAVRSGSEIHSLEGHCGLLASGPGWRLSAGSYRVVVEALSPRQEMMETELQPVASIEILLNGMVSKRLMLSSSDLDESGPKLGMHAIDFTVVATKVPAPLFELTPLTEIRILSSTVMRMRVCSVQVSKL